MAPPLPITLRSDEKVIHNKPKHIILLAGNLFVVGIAWSVVAIPLLFLFAAVPAFSDRWILLIFAVVIPILSVLWTIDNWRNDRYVLTNKRVVHAEKVIPLYNWQQEAELDNIASVVSVRPFVLLRRFNYGTVAVETASVSGLIEFRGVSDSDRVRDDIIAAQQAYRPTPLQDQTDPQVAGGQLGLWRKHPIVLVFSVFEPVVFLLTPIVLLILFRVLETILGVDTDVPQVLVVAVATGILSISIILKIPSFTELIARESEHAQIYGFAVKTIIVVFTLTAIGAVIVVGLGFGMTAALWVVIILYYVVVITWLTLVVIDWWNDEYQLTYDQVLDISRTPLIQRKRRTALLNRIQDVTTNKRGVGVLFDYGMVTIATAGESPVIFDKVAKPDQVKNVVLRQSRRFIDEEQKRTQDAILQSLDFWYTSVPPPE